LVSQKCNLEFQLTNHIGGVELGCRQLASFAKHDLSIW